MLKRAIGQHADKSTRVVNVARTLHTYYNTLKILCQAFGIEYEGSCFKCEKRLIEQAHSLDNIGKTLIVIPACVSTLVDIIIGLPKIQVSGQAEVGSAGEQPAKE